MGSLSLWVFSDPDARQTADGRHTFYRVEGRIAEEGNAFALNCIGGVSGEGLTPDDALRIAMQRAVEKMHDADKRRFEAQVAMMRSGYYSLIDR